MNDLEKAEIKQNKAIRGYIIRCLVKGYNNTALTRQLSNAMIAAGLIISPDIASILITFREPDISNLPRKRSQPTMPMPMMRSSSSPRKA